MTSFKYFYVFESSEVLMFCDGVNNYIKKNCYQSLFYTFEKGCSNVGLRTKCYYLFTFLSCPLYKYVLISLF